MNAHAKAASTRSNSAWGIVALLAALAVCALLPAGAFATNTRVPTAFSPIDGTGTGTAFTATPTDVAVDESAGRVFVLVGSEVRIFNTEGGVPAGVAAPYSITGLSGANSVAVDNSSSSPSHGALYVATNSGAVKKFVLNGTTEAFEAAGELVASPALSSCPEIPDIAVDTHGDVYVYCQHGPVTEEHLLIKFSPTGLELVREEVAVERELSNGSFQRVGLGISNLAVDAAGDLFVTSGSFGSGISNEVWKFPSNGSGGVQGEAGEIVAPAISKAEIFYGPIAMDAAANQLYVSLSSRLVTQYDATSLVKSPNTFGPEFLTQRSRFAVDSDTESVYSIDNKKVVVFGPEVPLPTININETEAEGTTAKLQASINPLGLPLEECVFEWGETDSYGTAETCEGLPLPVDSHLHPVSLALSGLIPQGHVYHFRIKVKNSNGPEVTEDQTFTTGEIFSTGSASEIATTTATVGGTVRPEGAPLTECAFEYGINAGYGHSVPCNPSAEQIPGDSAAHSVSGALTGLQPNTTYHYRIAGESSLGSFFGADKTFTTLGPPLVEEEGALSGLTTATLLTYVNPRGFNTTYHFEYGPTTGYGSRAPAESDPFVGSGTSPAQGTARISGLSENTTYHYRVVATSNAGTTRGPDQTFTTERPNSSCPNAAIRASQTSKLYPEGTTYLPKCMAFELISPPKKFNQYAKQGTLSASGERAVFQSVAALAETPVLSFINQNYVATRTATGWVTSPVAAVKGFTGGALGSVCAYSVDMSRWNSWGSTKAQESAGIATMYEAGVGLPYTPISPLLFQRTGQPQFIQTSSGCEGGSADASHEFIDITAGDYIEGDPVGEGPNVYEAYLKGGTPTVELLARDKDGTVYGGQCGAELGGTVVFVGHTGLISELKTRGAISPDASRVYFSTRPSQPEGVECDKAANKLRIMERRMTPEGPVISEPIQGECTRVSPPCSAVDGDDEFAGASQEGDKILFATTRQLANSDLDTSRDLYIYDASKTTGSRLTQITAGDATDPHQGEDAGFLRLVDYAGDGSHVYFVAEGQLTTNPNPQGQVATQGKPNLYLWERDARHSSGRTVFIGTLAPFEQTKTSTELFQGDAVPALGPNVEDQSVGGNGHILVFLTEASLLPADRDGGYADVYRYDSKTGALQLISRAAPGGSENGPYNATMHPSASSMETSTLPRGGALLAAGRSVSEDGETIVFGTEEALDPRDTDGIATPYIWHAGQTAAIPGGALLNHRSISQNLSLEGNEALFASAEQLVPQDGDTVEDVYALRAFGGFPPPPQQQPCAGEACQEPFRAQPSTQGAPTATYSGPGNPKPSGKSKGKHKKHKKHHGKHHKKKHGKKRKSPRKHKKANNRRTHKRAAGNEHGGRK